MPKPEWRQPERQPGKPSPFFVGMDAKLFDIHNRKPTFEITEAKASSDSPYAELCRRILSKTKKRHWTVRSFTWCVRKLRKLVFGLKTANPKDWAKYV